MAREAPPVDPALAAERRVGYSDARLIWDALRHCAHRVARKVDDACGYLSCLLPLGAIIAGLITPLPEFGATSEAGAPGRPPSVLKQLLGLFMKVGGLISAALGMVNTVLGKIGGGFVMCLNVVLCGKIQVVIASGVQIALGFASVMQIRDALKVAKTAPAAMVISLMVVGVNLPDSLGWLFGTRAHVVSIFAVEDGPRCVTLPR